MDEIKTYEKALKKTKKFFEESAKAKERVSALLDFCEVTNDEQQIRFFTENSGQIFKISSDSFEHQCTKLRDKNKRLITIPSKETDDLFRSIEVLERLIHLCESQVKRGWMNVEILSIIERLLMIANHPALRLRGFQLVLLFLRIYGTEVERPIEIFKSAILINSLKPFEYPEASSFCIGTDETSDISKLLVTLGHVPSSKSPKTAYQNPEVAAWSDGCILFLFNYSCESKLYNSRPQCARRTRSYHDGF
jgi:hypothetical protein